MMKANLSRPLVVLAVGLVAVAVALFGVGQRSAETQTATTNIQVQDLGTLGNDYRDVVTTGINDAGQVVGYSYDNNGYAHAFLYDESATPKMRDLGTLGGGSSYAFDINNAGQVVGTSSGHAFIYDSASGMKDLNDLLAADSGWPYSDWPITSAFAINSSGKIVVRWDWGGFLLTPATTATPTTYEVQYLGTLGLSDFGVIFAADINDSDQVVGTESWDYTEGGFPRTWHGFLYDESATPKMRNLGGYSSPSRINNSGKVVGGDWLYDNVTQQWQVLGGTVEGYCVSPAAGINDSNQVVGNLVKRGEEHAPHAFLKESGRPLIDLNTLLSADSGWTISSASAINNDGKIAATGYKDGGGTHALLLTLPSDIPPPPEDIEAPSPPTIIGLVGHQDTYDSDGSFTVYGTAEGGSTVELFEGTTSKGTYKSPNPCSDVWSIDLSGISEGTHTYTAKATDAAGNTSSVSESVTVTVGKPAPTVSSTSPANNASGVAATANVTATFSGDMDPSTLTTGTFTLTKQGSSTPVAAHVTYDTTNNKAILDPDPTLEASTTYTATIKGGSTGVKDSAGNALAQDHTWTFTTGTQQHSPSCTITGTANAETISGTSSDDVICAGGGNDTVKGLGGNDTLKGEGGNDQLLGGVGNDTLDGGLGTDTASYSASLTAVIVSLATNAATGEGSDTFSGVENLLGSSKGDTLTGSDTNNKLTGGGGADTEQGGLGNDQVIGSGGADTLKGGDGDDAVDSKDGKNGNDSLDGGAGTDTKVTDTTEKSIVGIP